MKLEASCHCGMSSSRRSRILTPSSTGARRGRQELQRLPPEPEGARSHPRSTNCRCDQLEGTTHD